MCLCACLCGCASVVVVLCVFCACCSVSVCVSVWVRVCVCELCVGGKRMRKCGFLQNAWIDFNAPGPRFDTQIAQGKLWVRNGAAAGLVKMVASCLLRGKEMAVED